MKPTKEQITEKFNFCFWYYNGERWVEDENVVEAYSGAEARDFLRTKLGEEKYKKLGDRRRIIIC